MNSIAEYVYKYAQTTPKRICLIDDSGITSYKDYWNMVEKLAFTFKNHGVNVGSNVVVECNQTALYLAIELALHILHAVFVPLEKNCAPMRILDIARQCEAPFIITNQSFNDHPCLSYSQLAEEIRRNSQLEEYSFPSKEEISEILFSTGTTGQPKGIMLSHGNDIALAENVVYGVKMPQDNVELIPAPLNHSHGLRRYYGNMYNGSTVIIMNGVLNLNQFFGYLDMYPVTSLDLVPSALAVIFKLSKNKLGNYKNQLKYIQLGTAPLPEEHKIMLCSLLPNTRLYNFYGSTESGCTCILDFNDSTPRPGCIGQPTVNAEFITVDDNRNEIISTPSSTGLLATRGAMNMIGYFEDPTETDKVLQNGYVYTSDLAYIQDGFIYLIGRKGEVINVGGNKVSPQEIEDLVARYTGIKDCACIGISDTLKGQVPKLFVVADADQYLDIPNLRFFLSQNLEPYKVPKQIKQIDAIPRTFNGKIIRSSLQ